MQKRTSTGRRWRPSHWFVMSFHGALLSNTLSNNKSAQKQVTMRTDVLRALCNILIFRVRLYFKCICYAPNTVAAYLYQSVHASLISVGTTSPNTKTDSTPAVKNASSLSEWRLLRFLNATLIFCPFRLSRTVHNAPNIEAPTLFLFVQTIPSQAPS